MAKSSRDYRTVDSRYFVESAARVIDLLKLIARGGQSTTLNELVERSGWNKPTVYRLVRTLLTSGALREVSGSGYALGPVLIEIGQAALNNTELRQIAKPHLERFFSSCHETINLTLLDGQDIFYLDRVESQQVIGVKLGVGSRLPAYCTSAGQVLLAGLDDDEVRRRLGNFDFERRAPNTIGSLKRLLVRLKEVRSRGWAVNDEELEIGHRAAAAPVLDHTGRTVAAVNVSVFAARVSTAHLTGRLLPFLQRAAIGISADLGYTAPGLASSPPKAKTTNPLSQLRTESS